MDNKNAWNNVLLDIELNVSKATFTTWFRNTFIVKQEEGTIYVSVPSIFVRDWILNHHHKFILRSLRTLSENVRAVEYLIAKDEAPKKADSVPFRITSSESLGRELPLADLYINKDDNLNPRYTFDSFVVGPFNELAHAAAQAIIKKPVVYNPVLP